MTALRGDLVKVAYTAEEAKARLSQLKKLRARVDEQMERMARVIADAEKGKVHRRSRYEIPPCGTESAYQRHRYYGEPRDDDCLRAHREHTAEQAASRRGVIQQTIEGAA